MTKIDIVECVYEKVGFSKKEASALVEFVFDAIKSSLERGEKVKVSGFGAFQPRFKRSRAGRNPHSGEPMEITARRVVRFVPSELLKAQLNAAPDDGVLPSEE